ncbi:testis-expressed protein 2-like [Alosa sapidissima]|uniref:testis-expressed protein 2-like n=1 Tax=Alosa sapidissima TaxID=34773 RepID=UPI001C08929D|nr:testis-expressed protein 2-like [Alosa sapidissima]XP_041940951.1 testis-expressed protein 2-like [Alosa sapidissima]XP_041940952.1 testis-expressed protein 2-like [Alosa sapidissima]
MEDSELVLSLDCDEEGPSVSFSKERQRATAEDTGQRSHGFRVPLSPSSPDLSVSTPGLLSNLVKSSSSDIETTQEAQGTIRSKPLFSLVKSLSSEISHHDSEPAALSKSDSRLHHPQPWKQLILSQPAPRVAQPDVPPGGDPLTQMEDPRSPGSLSPTEGGGRSSSIIAELEDTRRKFSEAMQEPFNMFSKMMGDEGSPKQKAGGDSPSSQGIGGGVNIPVKGEDAGGGQKEVGSGSPLAVFDTPCRKLWTAPVDPSQSLEVPRRSTKMGGKDIRYEICTFGDVMQVVEVQGSSKAGGSGKQSQSQSQSQSRPQPQPPLFPLRQFSSWPFRWFFCVGFLVYTFFVVPLPSYLTGLSLGIACGFMMGLWAVMFLAPKRPVRRMPLPQRAPPSPDDSMPTESLSKTHTDQGLLQGWMNAMDAYDPETYQPSLTHSVYATLDGSCLRLSYPRSNIPRRATFNEPLHEAVFTHTRTFQLANSKVFLLPSALARKRIWNKKYPICLILAEGAESREEGMVGHAMEGEDEEKGDKHPLLSDSERDLPTTLYLFGRTGREKEEWFQHFLSASKGDIQGKLRQDESQTEVCSGGGSSQGSTEDLSSMLGLKEVSGAMREKVLLDYDSYMAHFVCRSGSPTPSPSHSDSGSPQIRKRFSSDPGLGPGDLEPAWVNAMLGRIFWDFLRERYWADLVAHKVQKKLTKIRLPYFMNELTLAELDMGTCLPQVLSTSKPSVDHRGLWLEMEIVYAGSLQMTLETKMDLCKLGRESVSEADTIPETSHLSSNPRLSMLADSDEESSSAGSSDEEEVMPAEPQGTLGDKGTPPGADGHAGGSTGRRFLRFVDKIAKSKYFQKATENEYIKKKIAEVSNTPLLLTVEVLELSGTLAVNIPPPPTDRIWYSFRVPPRLDLRVRPMLGEREVTFTHVTEWIERKLQCEFQKVFVMPNMDDLYLPLMTPAVDNPPASHDSTSQCSQKSSVDLQGSREDSFGSE